jgi:ABC-type sugar transport system substrate-binding protein
MSRGGAGAEQPERSLDTLLKSFLHNQPLTYKEETMLTKLKLTAVLATALAFGALPTLSSAADHLTAPAPLKAPLAAKDIVVAGIVFQDDQFMKTMVRGFQDGATKAGVPAANILISNSSNDQVKETELINTMVSRGVNGIAITPLSPTVSMEALKQANDKGVAVAITNSGGFTDVGFVVAGYMSENGANGAAMGQAAAQYVKAHNLAVPIKLGIINYDAQKPEESALRWKGFEEALKKAGVDFVQVAAQSAIVQDAALVAATDMLTAHPEIQLMFASNEGGTIGAVQAVKQSGKKIPVFGYDGSDQITSMIINNDLQAAVAQDPYAQGVMAMTDLVGWLEGKPGNSVGKLTVAPGVVLSGTDKAAVNKWRVDNSLKELPIK